VGRASRARRRRPAAEAVAQVVYSAYALEDLERALVLLREKNPEAAVAAAAGIRSAVETLGSHPLIGRRVEGDLRELVISYGATGFIALYRFDVRRDQVRVLALRHQREIGYLP
jgi:plasmid stabilization system protein ParE